MNVSGTAGHEISFWDCPGNCRMVGKYVMYVYLSHLLIYDRAHCKTMWWLLCIASTTEKSRYTSAFMILCQVVDLIHWMYYFIRLIIVFAGRNDRENFKKFGIEKSVKSFHYASYSLIVPIIYN